MKMIRLSDNIDKLIIDRNNLHEEIKDILHEVNFDSLEIKYKFPWNDRTDTPSSYKRRLINHLLESEDNKV